MFKISIVETPSQRRMVLEGKLVSPWTDEVLAEWAKAGEHLEGRSLLVDLTNVTLISAEGEQVLSEMMRGGARFSCCGVLTRYLVRRLARRINANG